MIYVYAPTNDTDEQTKDFYGKLLEVSEQVHNHDMLMMGTLSSALEE